MRFRSCVDRAISVEVCLEDEAGRRQCAQTSRPLSRGSYPATRTSRTIWSTAPAIAATASAPAPARAPAVSFPRRAPLAQRARRDRQRADEYLHQGYTVQERIIRAPHASHEGQGSKPAGHRHRTSSSATPLGRRVTCARRCAPFPGRPRRARRRRRSPVRRAPAARQSRAAIAVRRSSRWRAYRAQARAAARDDRAGGCSQHERSERLDSTDPCGIGRITGRRQDRDPGRWFTRSARRTRGRRSGRRCRSRLAPCENVRSPLELASATVMPRGSTRVPHA